MFDARMRDFLVRLLALAGLGFSVLLLVEYVSPSYAVCQAGGGCDAVRLSHYSSIFGIHVPAYGVAFFLTVLVLSMVPRSWARTAQLALTCAGALAAIVFLYLQHSKIGEFCIFCVAVDGIVLVIAVLAITLRKAEAPDLEMPQWLIYGLAAAAVSATGFAIPTTQRETPPEMDVVAELPPAVAAEQRDGVVTIVEFVDFQCPACRAQHEQMTAALRGYGDDVRIVYKHSPLVRHHHAKDAARAVVCAQDKEHEMADALFTAAQPSKDFADRYAQRLDLNMDEFRACLESEDTVKRLAADLEAAKEAEVSGLPTGFIGNERFAGVRPAADVRRAIERVKK
jgi:protein-disulfide isomerase